MQQKIIQMLESAQPQWAASLREACWTLQGDILSLAVANPTIEEQLKGGSSLLLRLLQKTLDIPIAKLSILSMGEGAAANTSGSPAQVSVDSQSPLSVPSPAAPPPAASKPEIESQLNSGTPEVQPAFMAESVAVNRPEESAKEDPKEDLKEAPKGTPAENDKKRAQVISDYSQLPPSIQLLQKVFLAQVQQIESENE
ncbi:MAG: hypothetical protein AAF975_07315 [Spirochaetota bacterium]